MKKYFLILIAMVFLLSCESEKDPCDIEYQLNEPGGFGRNEVTFLINDEYIWYTKGSGVSSSSGGFGGTSSDGRFSILKHIKRDENDIPILNENGDTTYYHSIFCLFSNENECENNLYFEYIGKFDFAFDNFEDNDARNNAFYLQNLYPNPIHNNGNYYKSKSSPIKSEVYMNMKDSIVYGTFEGYLFYHKKIDEMWTLIDSIKISKGVFDYKFKEIKQGREQ